jgi:hypothetical protein
MMELSHEGKGFITFVSVIVLAILIVVAAIGFMSLLFEKIEYEADCSITGVNTGVNEDMNFIGLNLNDSEIKCKISGEAPLILIGSLSE